MSLPIAYLRRTYQCVSNSINMSYFWYMSTISTGLSAYLSKNKNIQTFPYKYLGIQLDIAPVEKDKVTFGTQFRKLIMTNLFAFGKSKMQRGKKPRTPPPRESWSFRKRSLSCNLLDCPKEFSK